MKSLCCLLLLMVACAAQASDHTVSLAGRWRFALDRTDSGISQKWFERRLADQIRLPGSLPQQGIGDDITLQTPWTGGVNDPSFFTAPEYAKDREPGHIRIPFWLQPEKYYAGVTWFQRNITVPADWKNRRVVLFLERPHWETRVWVDGQPMGTNDSLGTPHEYDLGHLKPGKHLLSIRVDNRRIVDIGENSHAITDHTQGNWNGIVGRIEMRSTPLVWIEEVRIYPNVAKKSARVVVVATNATGGQFDGKLSLSFERAGKSLRLPVSQNFNTAARDLTSDIEVELGADAPLWDEFNPAVLSVRAELRGEVAGETIQDESRANFGLREISTQGTQFAINGHKTFIRGTLECSIFPKTGHPPTEIGEWKRIIRVAKAHGLNLLRFHSYCPPEAAFDAADESGMYFQIETCWANQSVTLGDGKPVDEWVYRETERILKAYGNHPCFILMPYGNEPGGKNVAPYLAKYVEHFKAMDPRRLWTSGSGWPQLPANQFHVTPDPRIQAWGEGLKSRINAKAPETETDYRDYIAQRGVPVISHEIGQWCVYPNFDEIPKYTGYLKPKNFEIFRERLDANGMGALAHRFLLASGKLQTLCYKEDIESALRTPGMGGFELLDLHDFPGQGTALVGVLDPFWDDKGYVTASEYSRYCNHTVPLARLPKRVFTTDESLTAKIEVAHFGAEPIHGAVTDWKLMENNRVLAEGKLPARDIPIDNGISLGDIAIDLKNVPAPSHCRLVVSVGGRENDWDVWIYPSKISDSAASDVLVTSHFDDAARARLQAGGKVLLTIPGKEVRNYVTAPVKLGFSSIFWNTAWTGRQAPTTLGILCDPQNPALAEFPTDYYSDWQWWYLVHRAGGLRMDLLPRDVEPIVRVIDDWVTAHPLALVAETKVAAGRMIICGFDLTHDADDPVSRQMLRSLLDYMNSPKFAPRGKVAFEQVETLVTVDKKVLSNIKHIVADSAQEGYEAENATDANPETFWHSSWEEGAHGFPHELTIELKKPQSIAGITALPRQDGNQNGWIKDYVVYASVDGQNWGEPMARGIFSKNAKLKTVTFAAPVNARFIKLVAVSGYASGPWASLAELNVIGVNPQ